MNPEAVIESPRSNWLFILRAWSVHLYTSLGLVCAFLAVNAIFNRNPRLTMLFLGIAMLIDATDGTLARAWKVKVWAPTFDGRKLDDITDYLTYAFIPLFFAWQFGLLGPRSLVVLFICLIAAAYGFCNESAKTRDGYFTGFPNFWDLVVFYLFLLRPPAFVSEIILLFCAAMIFVPIGYISFSTRPFRRLTVAVTLIYGVVCLVLISTFDHPNLYLVYASLLAPLYYVGMSFYLHFKVRQAEA